MRWLALCGWVLCASGLAQSNANGSKRVVALSEIVPRGDPLAWQELRFDSSFAQDAIAYLRSGDSALLDRLASSAATQHILAHARNFDYDVPKDSPQNLVSHLLSPRDKQLEHVAGCEQSLNFFNGAMLADPYWVNDTMRYLPRDFQFHGSLFLTFGYDIGVAFSSMASLNCSHSHFEGHPRELLYYAIHELHHVGFMSYQPPPKLSEIKTCADLLRLVEYSTQLEGMAVYAAYQRRSDEHALNDDADYVALQDEARMQAEENSYFADFTYLQKRGNVLADDEAWAVINRMSSGERLWYRVGARMAQRIEQTSGRTALIELIKQGPTAYLDAYQKLLKSHSGALLP